MSTAESTLVHANFSQYNQNGGSLKKKKLQLDINQSTEVVYTHKAEKGVNIYIFKVLTQTYRYERNIRKPP